MRYVQLWVCPRDPSHEPYKAPLPAVAVVCKECAKATPYAGGRLPPASQLAMCLITSPERVK